MYIYLLDEEQVAADIFLFGADDFGELQDGTIGSQSSGDMRHYRIALPFADTQHSEDSRIRAHVLSARFGQRHARL